MKLKDFEKSIIIVSYFHLDDIVSTSFSNGIESTIIGGETSLDGSSELTDEEQEND